MKGLFPELLQTKFGPVGWLENNDQKIRER
jgi:hypothetical protein